MAAPQPERLLAGRYRLHAVIGRGGMGAVWRARDELLNRDVAVKEIIWPAQLDAAEREAARRRAVREAQMAARIDHPNVVRVYDIFEQDNRPCIVMELLAYPSLRDVLREDGPLSAADAARVGLGVLAGLRAAHDAGVVHRDVKPANILLGPGGRVVLTDFGIAKSIDSPALTTSGVLVGSPPYIAPERARGGRAGPAADLWGLGASLYAAVEGRPPFQRGSVLASLTAVVADEPDPPAHAGPLGPVISGLLRKDPGTRLGIDQAEQMLHRIAGDEQLIPGMQYRDDSQATARLDRAALPAAATGRRGPGPGRSRPRLVALAAALVIAVIVAGIALLAGRPHGHQTASPAAPTVSPTARAPTTAPAAPTSAGPPPVSSAQPASSAPAPATPGSVPGVGRDGGVPDGYHRFTDPTGFSIGVPAGWPVSHVGHYVYVTDPANRGNYLIIDQSGQPKPDPLADWQQQAAARQGSYPGYHLIMLRAVRYPQAQKAADWEFTYDKNGIIIQVLNRNILANAHHAYALYWSTPASQWDAYYHFFQVFAATFKPAGPLSSAWVARGLIGLPDAGSASVPCDGVKGSEGRGQHRRVLGRRPARQLHADHAGRGVDIHQLAVDAQAEQDSRPPGRGTQNVFRYIPPGMPVSVGLAAKASPDPGSPVSVSLTHQAGSTCLPFTDRPPSASIWPKRARSRSAVLIPPSWTVTPARSTEMSASCSAQRRLQITSDSSSGIRAPAARSHAQLSTSVSQDR